MDLHHYVRTIPGFPKPGILFRDITTVLQDPYAFTKLLDSMEQHVAQEKFDVIAGIESRGFILGAALADRLRKSFVPVRKKGKLPYKTVKQEYTLEYGTDCVEIHADAINHDCRVLVVDDLIATGGTALAACQLIEKLGGVVVGCLFAIDLPELRGREKLSPRKTFAVLSFQVH